MAAKTKAQPGIVSRIPISAWAGIAGVSIIVNVVTISVLGFLYSPFGSYTMLTTGVDQMCNRDYDWVMSNWTGSDNEKTLFSQLYCAKGVTFELKDGLATAIKQ